jgi:hypothetical protein
MITSAVNRLAHTDEREGPGRWLNTPDVRLHAQPALLTLFHLAASGLSMHSNEIVVLK